MTRQSNTTFQSSEADPMSTSVESTTFQQRLLRCLSTQLNISDEELRSSNLECLDQTMAQLGRGDIHTDITILQRCLEEAKELLAMLPQFTHNEHWQQLLIAHLQVSIIRMETACCNIAHHVEREAE